MIRKVIFVDTSAIYPIFTPNDSARKICVEILRELIEEYRVSLVTTKLVEYEILSRLRKNGYNSCLDFYRMIEKGVLLVYKITDSIENLGLQYFWRYKDKTWGVIDCISFAFMHLYNIYYAFTQDKHFMQAGFFSLIQLDHLKNLRRHIQN